MCIGLRAQSEEYFEINSLFFTNDLMTIDFINFNIFNNKPQTI
jgi:hypothetical protein